MTNISIVLTCNDRPGYLKETLDSWANVRGLTECFKYIFVEPSNMLEEVQSVITANPVLYKVMHNEVKQGVLHNPWVAIDTAFDYGADFVILAEDDVIVSSDILEYFKYFVHGLSTEEFIGISAYSAESQGQPEMAYSLPCFNGLVWGTWKTSWVSLLRDTWDHDYSTHNGVPGIESGWDWNITRVMSSARKKFLFPELSRSRHIGRHGEHVQEWNFDSISPSPSFQLNRPKTNYSYGGDWWSHGL